METVLVTGANRGIGLALVREFLARHYSVIATARKPGGAEELHALAHGFGAGELTILKLDITNADSVGTVFEGISKSARCLDALINNAGIFPEEGDERFEQLDIEHFAAAFETNVVGTARVCKACLPLLRNSGRPRIVNISSGAGSISRKEDGKYYCYSTSKAALNMFTRALANELKASGIVVVALSPGWVKTEMGGPNAEISPEESARRIVRTVGELTIADAGQFLGRDGNRSEYAW